jgi:hypothetical protein
MRNYAQSGSCPEKKFCGGNGDDISEEMLHVRNDYLAYSGIRAMG